MSTKLDALSAKKEMLLKLVAECDEAIKGLASKEPEPVKAIKKGR